MRNTPEIDLPADEQLERDILGSCFGEDRTPLADCRAVLSAGEFFLESHRRIFESLCRLADSGEPLTYNRVQADMASRSMPVTFGELINLENYAWALDKLLQRGKDLARRRTFIARSWEALCDARDLTAPLADVAQRATAAIREVAGDSGSAQDRGDVEAIVTAAGGITAFMAPRVGIHSPWPDLDYATGGWQNGELILLAARPSMGKTAFALNAAYHAAVHDRHVAFYSYEMSRESLVKRLVSMLAGITFNDIQRGDLNRSERQVVHEKLAHLQALPLRIFQGSGKTVLALRCHAERLKAKGRLDLAVVDYIGLIRGFGDRQMNRNQEVGEICRRLKETAAELQVPYMVLSQLSRAPEARNDKRPLMSDLRDSGELENHADLIAFLHRPGYYKRDDLSLRTVAELIIAKQRNGDTPTIPLQFRGEYGRFEPG